MARIRSDLFERLKKSLGVSQRRVYELIEDKVRETNLPRNLAAIALANEREINISRFATEADLAVIRQAARDSAPRTVIIPSETTSRSAKKSRPGKGKASVGRQRQRRGNTVWVVYGRNEAIKQELFSLLRAFGLEPLEWTQAIKKTKKGSPYVGEILEAAFREAVAVVVLLTPDDEGMLKKEFRVTRDGPYEKKLTGQARANVLFEAGMAFGKNDNSTVLVQVGDIRPFSDIGGRHVVHLSAAPTSRQELAVKLANAGCNVDTSGTEWMTVGKFKI